MLYKPTLADVNIVDIVKESAGPECRSVTTYIRLYLVCITIYPIVIL